uniref:Uncharacterized protein n=1 Tax=Rhizophora mucronata TaxID=61149 RepID=A0A2P2IJV0_RHIMU
MCCSTLPPFCFQICPLRAGGGKGVMRCFQWHGVEDILILFQFFKELAACVLLGRGVHPNAGSSTMFSSQ